MAAGALIEANCARHGQPRSAAWTGLFFGTFMFLRERFEAPLVAGSAKANTASFADSWSWAQWYAGPNGEPVEPAYGRERDGARAGIRAGLEEPGRGNGLPRCPPLRAVVALPAGRAGTWHFQLIEGGWLLALALLLGAATVWLVRHRVA